MTPERYRETLADFDMLMSYAMALSQSLTGRRLAHAHEAYADTVFSKLLCHGLSLRKLCPSLDPTLLGELWDLASASAVARSLIEAYDALAYVAVHAVRQAERDFRIALWELHAKQRRLSMLERIGSVDPRIAELREAAAILTERVIEHACYDSVSKDLQRKIRHGECPPFHQSQRELNKSSGVNHEYYLTATMFLSQYVHTYPFSLQQLMNLQAGDTDSLRLSSMPLQFSLAFIAKAIDGMRLIWPDGDLPLSEEAERCLKRWLRIAENGVRDATA